MIPQLRQELLDEKTINTIVKDLLDPGDDILNKYEEALHIELLQLATLLIRHLKTQLVSHRKELIKFAWDRLKRDETTSKQWAYVNVCRFIEAYDAPHKIILQVYVALLRAFQPEQRPLQKQALDILTPALPKRLPPQEHKYPIWIRYTKKIIVEEGHSLPHLIHIWHFLVRHADLCRSASDELAAAAAGLDPTDARALAAASPALAAEAVRRWLRPHTRGYPPDQGAVERVLEVARLERRACEIAGGIRISRRAGRLEVELRSLS